MIYDLSKDIEIQKSQTYFDYLKKKGCVIELKEKRKKRSINQNSYLHVLFSLFGIKFGFTIDEAKELIKFKLGYVYTKKGNDFFQKTSKMDSKELTIFIERFRNYSSSLGLYLPSSDEYLFGFADYDRQIADNEIYLK